MYILHIKYIIILVNSIFQTFYRLCEQDLVQFVINCQKQSGGFGPSPQHDASILYTLSGIQVLIETKHENINKGLYKPALGAIM